MCVMEHTVHSAFVWFLTYVQTFLQLFVTLAPKNRQSARQTLSSPARCNRSVWVNCDYLSQLWIHYPNSSCSAKHSSVIRELYPANCRFTTHWATTRTQRQYHCHNKLPRNSPIKREGMIIKSSGFARISHSRTKEPTHRFSSFVFLYTTRSRWCGFGHVQKVASRESQRREKKGLAFVIFAIKYIRLFNLEKKKYRLLCINPTSIILWWTNTTASGHEEISRGLS
jgi:hypothetical protein